MSRNRCGGSFSRHRRSNRADRGGSRLRKGAPVGLALEDLDDGVGDRLAGERRAGRSTFRRAHSRTPRCPRVCLPACHAPARGSCRPAFRECRPSSVPLNESDRDSSVRSRCQPRWSSPSRSRAPCSHVADGRPRGLAARCWPASDRDGRSLSRAPPRARRQSVWRSPARQRSGAARVSGDRPASALDELEDQRGHAVDLFQPIDRADVG